jgi:hypothetical protein
MKIQLDAAGEILTEEYEGETTTYTQSEGTTTTSTSGSNDPNAPVDYTDEELAAALPFTQAIGSPEQSELDGMQAREKWCLEKANEIASYDKDGVPRYVQGELERAQLLRQAKGLRDSMGLQLLMSQRSIARRYLDGQKQTADAQQELANHAALEQRARDITFETQAQQLAKLFMKNNKMNIG